MRTNVAELVQLWHQNPRYLESRVGKYKFWSDAMEDAFLRIICCVPAHGRVPCKVDGKLVGRNVLIARYVNYASGATVDKKQVSSHLQTVKTYIQGDQVLEDLLNECVPQYEYSWAEIVATCDSARPVAPVGSPAPLPSLPATPMTAASIELPPLVKRHTAMRSLPDVGRHARFGFPSPLSSRDPGMSEDDDDDRLARLLRAGTHRPVVVLVPADEELEFVVRPVKRPRKQMVLG